MTRWLSAPPVMPCRPYVKPVWAGDEDAQATTALVIGTVLVNSAATTSGAVLTFTAVSGVVAGMKVSGDPNLPINATVLSATGTTVTLTANVLGTVSAGTSLTFTSMTTAFVAGMTATGVTSGAIGTVLRATATSLNLQNVLGTFNSSEVVNGSSGATCKTQGTTYAQMLTGVYRHETGWDKIVGQTVNAIPASFTSCNFGVAVGAPFDDAAQTLDALTRVTRVEPDFGQVGDLTLNVLGKSYANQAYRVLDSQPMPAGTPFVTPRAQERILQLQVVSDTIGGFFQLGQTLVAMEPGDERGSS